MSGLEKFKDDFYTCIDSTDFEEFGDCMESRRMIPEDDY